MLKNIWAVGLVLCVGLVSHSVPAADPDHRASTRQLIVRLKDDGLRRIQAVRRTDTVPDIRLPDGRPVYFIRRFNGNGMVVRLPADVSLQEAQRIAEQLAENPAVASAQPDKRMYPALVPNDPEYPNQWHLIEDMAGIRMPSAWDQETGSASIVIAQLDTGIISHRDLNPARILAGFDLITDVATANDGDGRDSDPTDPGDAAVDNECGAGIPGEASSWHGLAVAGVMLAESDNAADISGIDFAARLLPVRVLGKCGGAVSDVVDGIRWAAGLSVAGVPDNSTPARVINLSLSGVGSCSFEEQAAINDAVNAGAVVVVAAGNEATDVATISPANCDNVVTVGAVGRDGSRASYVNTGEEVDLSGPGGDGDGPNADGILTLFNSGTTVPLADTLTEIQGTSLTTAQTSAVAALMWAASGNANVTLNPATIQDILRGTARAFPDSSCNPSLCGQGILDADAALASATMAPDTTLVNLSGTIKTVGGTDICAMVLASGQFMFSCNPPGFFSLTDLPRENNDTVKRQIYADGFFPKIDILTGSSADAVVMSRSSTCPSYNTLYEPGVFPGSAGNRINISGKVLLQNSQTPICAMVLANGQHVFSCDGTGSYALNIPLDTNGQFKLQVYADGFAPWTGKFDEFKTTNVVRMARAAECQ